LVEFTSKRGEQIRAAEIAFKKGKIDEWLKEQDVKWRCAKCGNPISWYEEVCHRCGAVLKESSEPDKKEKD
jgi:rubrerythrin